MSKYTTGRVDQSLSQILQGKYLKSAKRTILVLETRMSKPVILFFVFASLIFSPFVEAKKSSGSSGKSSSTRSSSPKYGTGSKQSSTNVKGYTKKDGTYIAPSKRSTPDSKVNNNWSTSGNTNPYTGKQGSKAGSPAEQ